MVEIAQTATICSWSPYGNERIGVSDVHDFVARAVQAATDDTRLFRYFDLYGSLLLNGRQMADFLADWEATKGLIASDLDQRTWDEVRALALRVQEGTHEFLRIDGD